MTDVAIRAENLKKVYRLYAKPSYRFRDMFGLLGDKAGAFTEHAALDGINLEIRRGEKVAIIGRNGAGKSTLLKLVTGVIQPTSGRLEVNASAHALLQIGTGFHPDFTGRQNAHAYLAQLGVTGSEADRRCAEAVDFAELEEYIDQPVKTYSTGMAVRLMFAVSTVLTPDLLILDEILGVGDAYFSKKSYERIRELCEHQRTTLLLVSHDIYTAAKLCSRMIWIDRGQIMADLDPPEALRFYEDAVRVQEESRLRKKAADAIRQSVQAAGTPTLDTLSVEVGFTGSDAPCPVFVDRVELLRDGAVVSEIETASHSSAPHGDVQLVTEGTAWTDPQMWAGRHCRALPHFGSVFRRVAVAFVRTIGEQPSEHEWSAALVLAAPEPVQVAISGYIGNRQVIAETATVGTSWQRVVAPITPEGTPASITPRTSVGIGAVAVCAARVHADGKRDVITLLHGRPAVFEFDFEIRDGSLSGPVDTVVSILRDGVDTVCRFFTRDLVFDAAVTPRGTLKLHVPSVRLGVGRYTVTIMLARNGYADQQGHQFYSINPDVYVCIRDVLEFNIKGGNLFAVSTVLAEGEWSIADTVSHVS